ncbi:tail protein [Brucella endophytica]|uniref:Tail protein n=1 Tax=Brucella endophytica TaxID=1963359 RepID=A0A916WEE7_9HYPH|nr:mitofilin family membrane protein [Brucella endophytica]GGA91817.1 tail protein [Brucella endophytica]
MAKSGLSRHSKPARKPVTIDLDPTQVKRVEESAAANAAPKRDVPPAEPVGDTVFTTRQATVGAKPQAGAEKENMAAKKSEEVKAEQVKTEKVSRPAAAASPAKPEQKQNAWLTHIAAGVAGGVAALGLMSALQWGDGGGSNAGFSEAQQTARQALARAEATESQVLKLREEVAKPANNNQESAQEMQALTSRLAALEEKFASTEAQARAAEQDSGNIEGMQSKLSALEGQVAEQSRQPAIVATIAAVALKSAVDRGGSFAAELNAYRTLAPQAADVSALDQFAAKGVPTIADLSSRFGAVADRIVATERNVNPDAGIVDQLVQSAKSLVKVRPVGAVPGASVGAIAARIEAALQAGDLNRAIAEWETLPQEAKSVSADFADQMKARRDTDALLSQALASALKPAAATATPAAPTAPK